MPKPITVTYSANDSQNVITQPIENSSLTAVVDAILKVKETTNAFLTNLLVKQGESLEDDVEVQSEGSEDSDSDK
jgi:hypothetical protein